MKHRMILSAVVILFLFTYSWSEPNPILQKPSIQVKQSDYFDIYDSRFKLKLLYTYQWKYGADMVHRYISFDDFTLVILDDMDKISLHTPEESIPIIGLKPTWVEKTRLKMTRSVDGNILVILPLEFDGQNAVYKLTGPFQDTTTEPEPIITDPGYLALLNNKFKLRYVGLLDTNPNMSYYGQNILGGENNQYLYFLSWQEISWQHDSLSEPVVKVISDPNPNVSHNLRTIFPGENGSTNILLLTNATGPENSRKYHLYKITGPFQPAAVVDFMEHE